MRNRRLLTATQRLRGLVLAGWASHLLAGFLQGVSRFDSITFVVVPLILSVVAALACYIPARRATRVDPLQTLRAE